MLGKPAWRHHKPMRSFWPYALGFLIAFSFLIGLLVWEWSCGPRHGWATAYPVCDFWTEQIAASKKTNHSTTFALSTRMPRSKVGTLTEHAVSTVTLNQFVNTNGLI